MAACLKCGAETVTALELGIYVVDAKNPSDMDDVRRTESKPIVLCDACGAKYEQYIVEAWNQWATIFGVR